MRNVNDEFELKSFKRSFYNVFKDRDPFTEMFKESVQERLILCPVDGFFLKNNQFDALMNAIKTVGEEKFFISEIEAEHDCFSQPPTKNHYQCKHWECMVPLNFDKYQSLPIIVENAIYSSTGQWGLIISHEEHAVLGGSSLFINKFKESYPNWLEELTNFKKMWEYNKLNYNSNIDWVKKLIDHIAN